MTARDPRVRPEGDEPHPSLDAVTELAERVNHQLDMLGVPRFVEAGKLTLLGRVAEWLDADAAEHGARPSDGLPVIGQVWGRGPRPPVGTRQQVEAWLRSGPGPYHGTVIGTGPGYVDVFGIGHHDEPVPGILAVRGYPLEAFLAKWWRP